MTTTLTQHVTISVVVSLGETDNFITFAYENGSPALAKVEALMALSRRVDEELKAQARILSPVFHSLADEM